MGPSRVVFQAHLELLHVFLTHRAAIVDTIETLLNAQRKPVEYLQDGPLLAEQFEDAFFTLPSLTDTQSRLRGQSEEAHWAGGFKPRPIPGLHNGPADPAELMLRAFYMWRQTRWPGRTGRVRYAQTLFNLYVIRCLELLTMRLWDDDQGAAGERLAQIQAVLDRLWSGNPPDQPVLVRDARWLIQMAQSLATDDLSAYFLVAERVADTLSPADRIEIHKAGVRMAGGHLRSQIRYHAISKGLALDDAALIRGTRTSNALDFALLVQELVPLLEAYEDAVRHDDQTKRLALADAICQGISPDPDLFVNRVELLGPYSMIEPIFITSDPGGQAAYTEIGRRHVRLFESYETVLARVAASLADDCARFRPVAGTYSPYGALYGFSSDLLKHMALKASQPDAVNHFGLEDVFAAGDADKLAWVSGWRKLPHLSREMEHLFAYPQQFADDIFARIEQALHTRVSHDEANTHLPTGRIVIVDSDDPQAVQGDVYDETQLRTDRREGKLLVSSQADDGWRALSKDLLTDVLATGRDMTIAGLPDAALGVLTLMCPRLMPR